MSDEFENWFTGLLLKTDSCFERDVLRGQKVALKAEWARQSGEPTESPTLEASTDVDWKTIVKLAGYFVERYGDEADGDEGKLADAEEWGELIVRAEVVLYQESPPEAATGELVEEALRAFVEHREGHPFDSMLRDDSMEMAVKWTANWVLRRLANRESPQSDFDEAEYLETIANSLGSIEDYLTSETPTHRELSAKNTLRQIRRSIRTVVRTLRKPPCGVTLTGTDESVKPLKPEGNHE